MKKLILNLIFFMLIIGSVNAITGSMGNAKMILRVEKEDIPITLQKYILVKNVNDEAINIKLVPTEEIKDIVKIYDEDFNLSSGEEKKARFDIIIKKEGNYNGKINVFFSPIDGKGAGVALSSTISVIAGENSDEEIIDEETDEETNDNSEEERGNVSVSLGGTGNVARNVDNTTFNPIIVGFIILISIVIILGVFILIKKVA